MFRRTFLGGAASLLGGASAAEASGRWRLQYFYDEDRSSLSIHALKFLSPQRGVALATLVRERGPQPVLLESDDGGTTWKQTPQRETALTFYFLDDSLGWMVTDRGIWKTTEGGRNWSKLGSLRGALRVHFLSEQTGFAVGVRKGVWRTVDGGKTWTKVKEAEAIQGTPERVAFTAIDFVGTKAGMIVGESRPRRTSATSEWWKPDSAKGREVPHLLLQLTTNDGGENWRGATGSIFGDVVALRLGRQGRGLAVFQFGGGMSYPGEVYEIDLRTGNSTRVFREKGRVATDAAWLPEGGALLGTVEVPAELPDVPIPGKIHMLRRVGTTWVPEPVDYRAVARRVIVSVLDGQTAWAATDTGMVLRWTPGAA